MSIVPKETIEVIAQSMGITNLSPEVALALSPDVEYRVREIMQEAIKCMRHSRRTILTADDVDSALSLRNVEPIYGFASGDPLRFKRAAGHNDLFYLDDKDVEFKDVIEAPLPKAPLDTAVAVHWLAIEGVQPAIPENAPVEALVAPSESKKSEHGKDDGSPFDIKLPVKHVLSRELQLYFVKITELIVNKSESDLFRKALISLATDSGLHPLVPYFTYFIADEVTRNLNNLPLLFALMRVVRSLLHNQHIHIEPYVLLRICDDRVAYCALAEDFSSQNKLHQLMPSIITCLVAKILGKRTVDDHWELRNFAANIVCFVCKRFGHMYPNLQTRVTKTLINAFLDPAKALTQHYGAIQGLAALGPNVVRLLVLPNLQPYLKLLEPEMLLEKQKNEIKRHEAWRVYGALLHAAGLSLYERTKLLRGLLAPPIHSVWRFNGKILTNKRKATADTPSQPSVKKQAVDGALGTVSGDFQQGNGDSFSNTSGEIRVGSSTAPGKMSVSNDGVPSGSGRDRIDRRVGSKTSSRLLMQAWKDDLDAGHLLPSLYELFGEGILPFVPSPEMSLFV